MSRTNEKRHISWHETCTCKCRLDASVYNNKQCSNNDKCRCECKELIGCDDEFIWNANISERICDKSCDVGEYLDYENCKRRKRLIDELVEECNEDDTLNTTDTISITNKKVTCKNNCLIYIISLILLTIKKYYLQVFLDECLCEL